MGQGVQLKFAKYELHRWNWGLNLSITCYMLFVNLYR